MSKTANKTLGLKAPKGLPEMAKRFWLDVVKDYELEPQHMELLTAACFQLGRTIQAREILDADGLTTLDRFSQLREHPMIGVERSSSLAFQRLMREMGLDVEPASVLRGHSRPGTRG